MALLNLRNLIIARYISLPATALLKYKRTLLLRQLCGSCYAGSGPYRPDVLLLKSINGIADVTIIHRNTSRRDIVAWRY
jgi:hypothetical protein